MRTAALLLLATAVLVALLVWSLQPLGARTAWFAFVVVWLVEWLLCRGSESNRRGCTHPLAG